MLQTYGGGCVRHLLRTNFDDGVWLAGFDGTFVQAVEDFLGDVLDDGQRAQCFLRLTGASVASAAWTATAAYLGSRAPTLHSAGTCLGEPSWTQFTGRRLGALGASWAVQGRSWPLGPS